MIRQRSHPDATVSTRRAEAYTDGVFAIAATLLVLDLTSRSFGEIHSDAELWTALAAMWPPVLTFVISFLLLSLMWMTHVGQFEHIARIDGVGIWINNIRLLLIVLVPFTSSVQTDFSEFLPGRVLLPANFFLVVLCGWVQWWWAMRHRETMIPDLSAEAARRQGRAALSALILAAVTLLASPILGSIAFFAFAFDGLLTRALRGSGGPLASGERNDTAA